MEGLLSMMMSSDNFPIVVLAVVVVCAIWLYKEWPGFVDFFSSGPLKEKAAKDANEALAAEIRELNVKILSIEEKLMNDFSRINRLERENDQIRKLAESSLEERHILMECNLALLKSVRELGANGPTGVAEAEEKLQQYLNKKAHIFGM